MNKKGALGTKLFIILLSISIVLTIAGYTQAQSDQIADYIGLDYSYSNVTNTSSLNTSAVNTTSGLISIQANNTGITAGITNFFDRFENVVALPVFIFSFFTAPIGIFTSLGIPFEITFLFGGIYLVLWGIAIAGFIWRKDL